eukprot:3417888-Rhodomonas_salina.2
MVASSQIALALGLTCDFASTSLTKAKKSQQIAARNQLRAAAFPVHTLRGPRPIGFDFAAVR